VINGSAWLTAYAVVFLQDLNALTACIHETNVNREPQRWIGEFGVLETLGQGAFGVVHKVRHTHHLGLHASPQLYTPSAHAYMCNQTV
jgi:hypothetical protein